MLLAIIIAILYCSILSELANVAIAFNESASLLALLFPANIPPIEVPAPAIAPATAPQGPPILAPVAAPDAVELITLPICCPVETPFKSFAL